MSKKHAANYATHPVLRPYRRWGSHRLYRLFTQRTTHCARRYDGGESARERAGSVAAFTRAGETKGLDGPESALFDSTQVVWFVSNIVGGSTEKDYNGFISRLKSDGLLDSRHFINSGVNGALLDAPKGLALHGDTIWTADIDVARAVDSHTGKPLATVDVRPLHAKMLNAVAVGPDGRIYITDTAIEMARARRRMSAPIAYSSSMPASSRASPSKTVR